MGIYSEYLDRGPTLDLQAERKKQLARIAESRKRAILVCASDSNKARQGAPVAIDNTDLLPVTDQVSNLTGKAIDVLLETGGGSGETAEDIVRLLHDKFESVAFIVPGMAKSAGTIMVMGGDEILMEPSSSLGPIDAQIQTEGKIFSAEAFLKGLENIKKEVAEKNSLNRAYIPILQRISPGEIQSAENALSFAKELVTEWLKEHKFKNWNVHQTHNPGTPVTPEEKEQRAKQIAEELCNHSKWLSHGRSIKIPDLELVGLKITDYSKDAKLADAIRRYHVLMQMTFDQTPIYKLFETPSSQIQRFFAQLPMGIPGFGQPMPLPSPGQPLPGPQAAPGQMLPTSALVQFKCPKCGKVHALQADFDKQQPLQPGAERFPSKDVLSCKQCGMSHNLVGLRTQLEFQTGRKLAR
jgi:ClpP class serine protease